LHLPMVVWVGTQAIDETCQFPADEATLLQGQMHPRVGMKKHKTQQHGEVSALQQPLVEGVDSAVVSACCGPEDERPAECAPLDIRYLTRYDPVENYLEPLPPKYRWEGDVCIFHDYPPAECCSSSRHSYDCSDVPVAMVDGYTDDHSDIGKTHYEWRGGSCRMSHYRCCVGADIGCEACRQGHSREVFEACCAPEDDRDAVCSEELRIHYVTQKGVLEDYSQDPLPPKYRWEGALCVFHDYAPAECCSPSRHLHDCSALSAVAEGHDFTDDYTKIGTPDYQWDHGACYITSYECCSGDGVPCQACRLGVTPNYQFTGKKRIGKGLACADIVDAGDSISVSSKGECALKCFQHGSISMNGDIRNTPPECTHFEWQQKHKVCKFCRGELALGDDEGDVATIHHDVARVFSVQVDLTLPTVD